MRYVILLALVVFLSTDTMAQIKWPGNKKSVIVLTYDDALLSQLNVAIPQLDKHKFKGTFFLDGRLQEADVARWREAAKDGHELANHSLYHPCSERAFKNRARLYSETYDVPSILADIQTMNKILFMIDGKKNIRTYAYPCTETVVGEKDYTDSLKRSKLVSYARIGGGSEAIITSKTIPDNLHVPSYGLQDGTKSDDLIAYTKRVQDAGGMGVIMFHGVGGDYITVSKEDHAKLLEYLATHKDIWVATFQEAMDWLAKQR